MAGNQAAPAAGAAPRVRTGRYGAGTPSAKATEGVHIPDTLRPDRRGAGTDHQHAGAVQNDAPTCASTTTDLFPAYARRMPELQTAKSPH